MELIIIPIIFVLIIIGGFFVFRSFRMEAGLSLPFIVLEYICFVVFGVSFFIFLLFQLDREDYYTAIDPIDIGYTAFASKHILTLGVFLILSIISLLAIWLRGRKLPPLLLVLSLTFVIIGMAISVFVIMQLSENTDDFMGDGRFGLPAPIVYLIVSVLLILKLVLEEIDHSQERNLQGEKLNKLNRCLANGALLPVWVIISILPVFCIIVIILTLFGQETDSIVEVFTETTTWHFSEMEHPPYLEHNGHYLCTVAACGHPALVKPLRYGTRHSIHKIVVNRQLQVANAFEERIMELFPRFHRLIRAIYDKYGYPLSKHITTPLKSDIVYILMKPLEYMFVIVLYLLDIKPEARIARQYKLKE
ncbi:MAG: hypothetical protein QM660_13785 [Dysgonomonas sp.]